MKALLASRQLGLLCALVLMFVGFALKSEPFRDPVNLLDRMRLWTEVGLIAVPMTYIIAAGGIDLSVGSLVALSTLVGGHCFANLGWSFPAALGATVMTGAIGGAINGFASSLLRLPSLVVTLATLAMFRGAALGLSHGQPIKGFPRPFNVWGNSATVGSGTLAPPQQFVILLVVFVLGEWLLRKSRAGRWTLQLGENETAARYAAIPVDRVRFGLFLVSGVACGFAAIASMGRLATAHPAYFPELALQAIACVVIGGTRITGGGASVTGTLLGLLLLATLDFGLEMTGVLQQIQTIVTGLLVVTIAVFNEWLGSRQSRRRPAPVSSSATPQEG
ncbi:MAG: ABC transporter permease [Fimbriimonas sp.]